MNPTTVAELQTSRLRMRGVTPALLHALFRSGTSSGITDYFGLSDEKRMQDLRRMHEEGCETYQSTFYFFVLDEKGGKTGIGECGFHSMDKKHQKAELFYLLHDSEDRNKGYVTEAVEKVLEFGFNELGLHRIAAMVAKDNTPSLRILSKFGFRFEGVLREDYLVDGRAEDSHLYSLLKPEWNAKQPE